MLTTYAEIYMCYINKHMVIFSKSNQSLYSLNCRGFREIECEKMREREKEKEREIKIWLLIYLFKIPPPRPIDICVSYST